MKNGRVFTLSKLTPTRLSLESAFIFRLGPKGFADWLSIAFRWLSPSPVNTSAWVALVVRTRVAAIVCQ